MERVTATIDAATLAAIREVAGPQGVSSFLEAAARERLARLRLLGLLDELDARYGAPARPSSARSMPMRDESSPEGADGKPPEESR